MPKPPSPPAYAVADDADATDDTNIEEEAALSDTPPVPPASIASVASGNSDEDRGIPFFEEASLGKGSNSRVEGESPEPVPAPKPFLAQSQIPPSRAASGPNIQVYVGSHDRTKIFRIKRQLACSTSRFFLQKCPMCRSAPAVVLLPGEDAAAFGMFSTWLERQPPPLEFDPDRCSEEPWFSSAAKAWALGKRLQAPRFERYALSQFVQNCAFMPFGPWKFVENVAEHRTPLRRFSDHWVAWNFYLAGGEPSEYAELEAASIVSSVTKKTSDPRFFDLSHWYLNCSDTLDPECAHDPAARRLRRSEWEAAEKRFNQPIRARRDSWNYEFRMQNEDWEDTESSDTASERGSWSTVATMGRANSP